MLQCRSERPAYSRSAFPHRFQDVSGLLCLLFAPRQQCSEAALHGNESRYVLTAQQVHTALCAYKAGACDADGWPTPGFVPVAVPPAAVQPNSQAMLRTAPLPAAHAAADGGASRSLSPLPLHSPLPSGEELAWGLDGDWQNRGIGRVFQSTSSIGP